MTSSTTNIGLTKTDDGELNGGWGVPERENHDIVDTAIGYLLDQISNASSAQANSTNYSLNPASLSKGSADSLKKRLDNAMEADGTPKSTPEVGYAKFDRLIGSLQGNFEALARLGQLFYWACQGQTDSDSIEKLDRLRKEIGRRGYHRRNSVLDDNLTVSVAASIPTIQSGDVTEFDIGGKIFNLRGTKAATSAISAKSTCFVYVQEGDAIDKLLYSGGDAEFVQSGSPSGAWNKFSSASNPSFANAKEGDILRLASNTSYGDFDVRGDYVIMTVSGGNITLFGGLPIPSSVTSVSGLSFEVINPFAVKVGYMEVAVTGTEYSEVGPTPPTVNDRAFVGEVHWNGGSLVDSFAYLSKGVYDTGWQEPAALSSPNPASISGDHRIGLGVPPFQVAATKSSWPLRVRLFVAQKNAAGYVYGVQEYRFNSEVAGATDPTVRAFGWFGYVNRKSFNIRFGAKLPVGAGYGFLRKSDAASFPNDGGADASYETTETSAAYRLVIERD